MCFWIHLISFGSAAANTVQVKVKTIGNLVHDSVPVSNNEVNIPIDSSYSNKSLTEI